MHIRPDTRSTVVLDWGTIKWFVNPTDIAGAESTFGEVIILPGRGHEPHAHPGAEEVLYVVEGEGVQTVGDSGPFPIVAGDAVYVPRGVTHSTHNTSWRSLRLVVTYTPGGEETALRGLPDFAEVPAGETPTWVRAATEGHR
jgi:oxalate decarboxylase/phosphoglucose isomerase-like protein (cupin superfamily)